MMEDAGGGRNMQGLQEGGGAQSGKAILSLQEAAQISLTNAIDNVRRFEAQIGRVIVKMISKYYPESNRFRLDRKNEGGFRAKQPIQRKYVKRFDRMDIH